MDNTDYDAQHTTEPEYAFSIIDLSTHPDENNWRYSEVTMRYVAKCNYCGGCIESNDPDYAWYHV